MKPLLLPAALALLLLFSADTPPVAGEEEGEWTRPYLPYLPGFEPLEESGAKSVVSVRLVRMVEDGLRVFVPYGTVSFHTEESHPQATGALLLAEGEGDEFGFVNVQKPEEPGEVWENGYHWHFEAPGQGAEHEFCNFGYFDEEEVILPGGVDREILVIDPFGRPLKGAKVSMYLGCPHSPVLRSGKSYFRGVATLENLPVDRDDDFWIEAPGIRFGPYHLAKAWVGQGGTTIITDPARTARGMVVDEEGVPVAGVVVRATGGYPRGPVAITDAAGSFVLHGVEWHHRLCFYRPDSPHVPRPDCIIRDFEEEVPLRVTLRQAKPTALTDGEPRQAVDIVAWIGQAPKTTAGEEVERQVEADDVPVVLSRTSDGFTVRGKTGDGTFREVLPAGRYVITAGGRFSRYQTARTEVELPRPAGEPVRVEILGDQGYVEIDTGQYSDDKYPRPSKIEVRIPGLVKDISDWHQFYSLRAPWGLVGLYVSPPARVLFASGRKVDLRPPPKNEIRFRCVDEDGGRVEPGKVTIDWDDLIPEKLEDGGFLVRTWACGTTRVEFGDVFLGGKSITVELPAEKAGIVDLGEIVLAGDEQEVDEGELRTIPLRFANGDPVTEDDLHWCLIRVYDGWEDWEDAELDENGAFSVEEGRGPFRLHVEGPHLYPLMTMVRPDGHDEIRLPPGEVSGELRDADGKALSGVVYIDSARYECPEGKILVRGIPAGPHIVIAGARNHVGEVRRIVLKDGETRDLRVTLRPR